MAALTSLCGRSRPRGAGVEAAALFSAANAENGMFGMVGDNGRMNPHARVLNCVRLLDTRRPRPWNPDFWGVGYAGTAVHLKQHTPPGYTICA